ncbi:MAG TPA: hypothetical protein VGR98_00060 [Streptosporangiaceae bacterium]|nr:hypothetical protein [Streptosporangiaceae bacterium]
MAGELAVRACEHPPSGFGDALVAVRAGRRGAPLVNELDGNPGGLGLVAERADEVADAPIAGAPVVSPPGSEVQHAARVAHSQGADPACGCPGDDVFGSLVLGLADSAPVPRLHQTLPPPVLPPPPRPLLTRFRGTAGDSPVAGLGVLVMLEVLGADRAARHQQPLPARARDRIWVDDAQVDSSHLSRVELLPG